MGLHSILYMRKIKLLNSISTADFLVYKYQISYFLFECIKDFKAPVDQSAQNIRTGWKNNRINLFESVSKPKASIP